MGFTLFWVDAFTDQLFAGNPAAVVPLDTWPKDAVMQAIATENGLAETAFFVPHDDGFQLRWFTPVYEVDLCGHATLATAHVLYQHLGYQQHQIVFHTLSGPLPVIQTGAGYQMDFPALTLTELPGKGAVSKALGAEPDELYSGMDIVAVFSSESKIRSIVPHLNHIAALDTRGLVVTAPGDEVDFVSRFFAPAAGVDEDPVTGSTHSLLTPFWSERLGKTSMVAHQLSKRGGELQVELVGDRVKIAGKAVTYLKGEIFY